MSGAAVAGAAVAAVAGALRRHSKVGVVPGTAGGRGKTRGLHTAANAAATARNELGLAITKLVEPTCAER